MWSLLVGGNGLVPAEAQGVLDKVLEQDYLGNRTKEVLDLGCGSGVW